MKTVLQIEVQGEGDELNAAEIREASFTVANAYKARVIEYRAEQAEANRIASEQAAVDAAKAPVEA